MIETDLHPATPVKVWDAPIRIFHWAVVSLVFISWLTADLGFMKGHLWSGSLLLTLLTFRIAWGVVGSTTARFANFVTGPGKVLDYLRALKTGAKKLAYPGHSPAGGWMVVVLLAALILQASIGLFANDGVHFNGPLAMSVDAETSDRLAELHRAMFSIILFLIWMHMVAVFFYLCVRRENLIAPMLTGKKCGVHLARAELRFASLSLALLVLALSAGIVWWIVA